LFTKHPVPFHFYAHDVGQALKDIGAPDTRAQLEALYLTVDGDDRDRVLDVIGQQEEPSFLPFLTRLITESNEASVVHGAGMAVARLVYGVHKVERKPSFEITEGRLAATALALHSAFHDERMRKEDGDFPDHTLLSKKQGAILSVGRFEHLLYISGNRQLRELSPENPDDLKLIEQAKSGCEDGFARGDVGWMEYADFMTLFLKIDQGGVGYLFRSENGKWVPVCGIGGYIE